MVVAIESCNVTPNKWAISPVSAGGSAFTKTFTGQIVIKGGTFIRAGDSGSLLVEDVTTNPRSVGLCFAGSSQYGIANPIDQVLSYLNATMVGH